MVEVVSKSAEDTKKLGKAIGEKLHGGEVVVLIGELGTGKTTMIKGICEGLGVSDPVESPTFTLINEYRGKVPVYHVDCYREERLEEWIELGISEYLYSDSVVLIEWGERLEEILPDDKITIHLFHDFDQEGVRYIQVDGIELSKNELRFLEE